MRESRLNVAGARKPSTVQSSSVGEADDFLIIE
jgi:hypothetical protein